MVATSSSQQTIYRSVPPRPLGFGLSEMLDTRSLGYGGRHRSSTAPVSINTAEEFAHRFKARPTTRPRIIKFDGSSVTPKGRHMMHQLPAVSNGFPMARAKIYIGQLKARSPTDLTNTQPLATVVSSRSQHSFSRVHLTPLHSSPSILVGGGGTSSATSASQRSPSCHINQTPASSALLPAAHVTHKTLQGQQQLQTQRSEKASHVAFSGSTAGGARTTYYHQPNSNASNGGIRMMSKSASSLGHSGAANSLRSSSSAPKASESQRETSKSTELATSIPHDLHSNHSDYIHNPELLLTSSTDCDDLCALPPPKKVLPKRELPWVFRFKVKRGMNTLSRIMASKPAKSVLHSNQAFT